MKKYILSIFFVCFGFGLVSSFGQDHQVAYTNIELILAYMPESKTIDQTLSAYQKKLEESIQIKQKYYQQKVQDFSEKEQSNRWIGETEKNDALNELQGLEAELQKAVQDAENNLAQKRSELLQPLTMKIQKAIDDVAKEKGYDYVLNNTIGGGIPSILSGDESKDITKDIGLKLGISME